MKVNRFALLSLNLRRAQGGRGGGKREGKMKPRNLATLRVRSRFNNVDFHPDIPAPLFFQV